MNVAVLSESPADEAAIRILIDGILGVETQVVEPAGLRSRGWPAVARVLPVVLRHLYYQTIADALVVIVDSDDSPVHQLQHEIAGNVDPACRVCELRRVAATVSSSLTPVAGRAELRVAVGLAVPAVEAWYRCGLDPHVNEVAWMRQLQSRQFAYDRRSLKRDVYGTDRPSLEIETRRAIEEATRLATNLAFLEQAFPSGFGTLASALRGW